MTALPLPAPVRAVLFDLDGTMYRQSPVRRGMAIRLVVAHLLRPRKGLRVLQVIRSYRQAQEDLRHSPSVDPATAQFEAASAASGTSVGEVQEIVDQWMGVEPLDLVARHSRPGLQDLLARLRHEDVRLGVLSDYPADQKLAALGVSDFFDVVLCAQDREVAAFKPSPRGIETALNQMGVPAELSVYVGDRPEVDAVAARAAGTACVIIGSTDADASAALDHHSCADFASLNRTLVCS